MPQACLQAWLTTSLTTPHPIPQMIKTRTSNPHRTDIQTFLLMLAGRANCSFHLLSLITPLASPTLTLPAFIHSFILSVVLSYRDPRHPCLCSLRIFQPTDGIFFLLCFVSVHFSLVRNTQTTDLSSCDSHRFAFACSCAHLIIKK